jgi:protein-L-isoaspartate O-methyltransferase
VGCAAAGSGYLTAAMAKLVQPHGFVLGVEKVPELVQHAKGCISRGRFSLLLLCVFGVKNTSVASSAAVYCSGGQRFQQQVASCACSSFAADQQAST